MAITPAVFLFIFLQLLMKLCFQKPYEFFLRLLHNSVYSAIYFFFIRIFVCLFGWVFWLIFSPNNLVAILPLVSLTP